MCLSPIFVKGNTFKCGKCIECQLQYSYEWAFRICLESSLYKDTCMVTLTYDEDNLPEGGILLKSDLQKFIKRLRINLERKENVKIRYFSCGEYGDMYGRPHYHVIIFGWKPKDLQFLKVDKKGNTLYTSAFLSTVWTNGFHSVGEVNLKTAKYCALYLQKLTDCGSKPRPFLIMSTKPGIGVGAIKEEWLKTDKIYFDGRYIKIPRYFLEYMKKQGYNEMGFIDTLKQKRIDNMNDYINRLWLSACEEVYEHKICDYINGEPIYTWDKFPTYIFDDKKLYELFQRPLEERRKKFIKIFGRWR